MSIYRPLSKEIQSPPLDRHPREQTQPSSQLSVSAYNPTMHRKHSTSRVVITQWRANKHAWSFWLRHGMGPAQVQGWKLTHAYSACVVENNMRPVHRPTFYNAVVQDFKVGGCSNKVYFTGNCAQTITCKLRVAVIDILYCILHLANSNSGPLPKSQKFQLAKIKTMLRSARANLVWCALN